MARLPRRWALPITQTVMVGLLARVLGALPEPARVGVGRVLPRRAILGVPAHQPVLDARQPRLRPAAGQATVRVRRRRRAARRHRRQRARRGRARRSAPSTCSSPRAALMFVLRVRRQRDRRPRERATGVVAGRQAGEGRERRRGDSSCCGLEALPDHRARHRFAVDWRRRSSSSSSTWRRRSAEGAGQGRLAPRSSPRSVFWMSVTGFVIQVTADEQDPPLPRHRLRADGAAGQPRQHGAHHAAQRRRSGRRPLARILDHVAALHRRQDDARDPVRAAADEHQATRPSRSSTSTVDRSPRAWAPPWRSSSRSRSSTSRGGSLSYLSLGVTRPLDLHGAARARGVPADLPPEPRDARRRRRASCA